MKALFIWILGRSFLSESEDLFVVGYPEPYGEFLNMRKTNPSKRFGKVLTFHVNHFDLPGTSGSPVLDSEGLVSGIVFNGDGENLVVMLDVSALEAFFKEEKVFCSSSLKKCLEDARLQNERRAVEGDVLAQYFLAQFYRENSNLQNLKNAVLWYKRSAERGFFMSQGVLAGMYYEGGGCGAKL